jgi:tRNA(fMet)-specific endonuclease VapC
MRYLLGPCDCQIAGCGLARGLVVVTSNTKEFERVSELRIENWRGAGNA